MVRKLVILTSILIVEFINKGCNHNNASSNEYVKIGIAEAKSGDHNKAIATFDKAIEFNPENYEALKNRGISKREVGDYTGALEDFDKALKIDSNDAVLFNFRGLNNEDLHNYLSAIEDYNRAIKISNNYAEAYHNRGFCKLKLNDTVSACTDWQYSIDLNGLGKFEFDSYCNKNKSLDIKNDTSKKSPPSPESIKFEGSMYRSQDLIINKNCCKFSYVYMNGNPYGRSATVNYDNFLKKYLISFTDANSGGLIKFKIEDSNFINTWVFNFRGNKYQLSNIILN